MWRRAGKFAVFYLFKCNLSAHFKMPNWHRQGWGSSCLLPVKIVWICLICFLKNKFFYNFKQVVIINKLRSKNGVFLYYLLFFQKTGNNLLKHKWLNTQKMPIVWKTPFSRRVIYKNILLHFFSLYNFHCVKQNPHTP